MKKVSFEDKEGNELIFHINIRNQLYLSAGSPNEYSSEYICLDKEDVVELIKSLKFILKEM